MSEIRKYIARYGAMKYQGIFSFSSEKPLFHGTRVIVRTGRGQETGTVLREATQEHIDRFKSSQRDEGRIVRVMTAADEAEERQLRSVEKDEFSRANAIIGRLGLVMSLVRMEHIFGGERLIVYYVAGGRVDFRELVKVLASEFQTRIEMRQIGVRDETKLLADLGDCGREVCCNAYLNNNIAPVSMKMAKLQKATLDPSKISGRCGRLKCCLRYEYDVYTEILEILPPIGKVVQTENGMGQVVMQEILAKKLLVEYADRTRKYVTMDEIQSFSQEGVDQDVFARVDETGWGARLGTRGHGCGKRGESRDGAKGRLGSREHGSREARISISRGTKGGSVQECPMEGIAERSAAGSASSRDTAMAEKFEAAARAAAAKTMEGGGAPAPGAESAPRKYSVPSFAERRANANGGNQDMGNEGSQGGRSQKHRAHGKENRFDKHWNPKKELRADSRKGRSGGKQGRPEKNDCPPRNPERHEHPNPKGGGQGDKQGGKGNPEP